LHRLQPGGRIDNILQRRLDAFRSQRHKALHPAKSQECPKHSGLHEPSRYTRSMNPLSNLLRIVAVAILALAGFVMAAVLLVTSIVALGVLYLVSRVRGRPMTFGSFRQSRQAAWSF